MTLNEEHLLQHALDGDVLSAEDKHHLAQCPTCQKHLAEYTKVNMFLLSLLYRRQCPSGTKLSYYCGGLLPTHEMDTIAAHLGVCPLCAAEAETSRRFLTECRL